MYLQLVLIFLLSLNILFLFSKHPLSSTLLIVTQTLLVCLLISKFAFNSWFSFVLFLIFLGGMLVLFIYMTSLTPNVLFTIFSWSIFMIIYLIFSVMLFNYFYTQINFCYSSMSDLLTLHSSDSFVYMEPSFPLATLFSSPILKFTWFLMIYLLITLIIVTKISNIFKGPLRKSK